MEGEYAWAMAHGIMVASVRADGPTRADLVSFLNDRKIEYSVINAAEAGDDEELVESGHERPWQYPSSGSTPGPIELIHIWLSLT